MTYYIKYISLIILLSTLSDVNIFAYNKITTLTPVDTPSEVEFFDETGNKHFLDEYEDNVVLLVFWASWCSACSGEIPALDVLQKDFRKLPFKILAVSEDFQGIEAAQNFFKTHEIRNLTIYHDPKNKLFRALDVIGTPTSFLINREGKIVMSFVGSTDWYHDDVRNVILSYLPAHLSEPKNSGKPEELNRRVKNIIKEEDVIQEPTNENTK
jgi:thiol-disulfide isomerase/thioredoxin